MEEAQRQRRIERSYEGAAASNGPPQRCGVPDMRTPEALRPYPI
jgi:hypothetical protein